MSSHSIRFRLTIWYALALTIGLLLFATAIWISTWHTLRGDIDQALLENLSSMQGFLSSELKDPNVALKEELAEYSNALPQGRYVQIAALRGTEVFTTRVDFPWPAVPMKSDGWTTLKWRHQSFRMLSRTISLGGDRWRISFASSIESEQSFLRRLALLLFALMPLVVAIAVLGGTWLSRRALKPVDEITAAARCIGIENLSERLAVPQTGDELERLSETWNGMLDRLEDAVSRLSRFTADASHELRTPLAVIRSTAEIAARKSRSADAYRRALQQIVGESERMTSLVDDLLFLARCDAERLQLSMERVSLDDVISEVCFSVTAAANSKGIHLTATVGEEGTTEVKGNRAALRRMLSVLVDNAIKYSNPGDAVTISLAKDSVQIHLQVADSGPGIPPDEIPLVFQRFYRGNLARSGGESGYGLGLALAKGIAQHHHAAIHVASRLGQGSVFDVVFPALRAEEKHLSSPGLNVDHSNVV
jgi:heavy metal sensor kinase